MPSFPVISVSGQSLTRVRLFGILRDVSIACLDWRIHEAGPTFPGTFGMSHKPATWRTWSAGCGCLLLACGAMGCASGQISVRRLPTPTPVIAQSANEAPTANPSVALDPTASAAAPTSSGTPEVPAALPAVSASAVELIPQPVTATEGTPPLRADAIGEIRIPGLNLASSIVEVSWHLGELEGQPVAEWDTIPDAVGHHLGTAPLGGVGNCVLSGHSRVDRDDGVIGVFRRLHELSPGDRIELIDASAVQHEYVVQRMETVQELGASIEQRMASAGFMEPMDGSWLTLITCWPDWGYTHRLIIVASLQ